MKNASEQQESARKENERLTEEKVKHEKEVENFKISVDELSRHVGKVQVQLNNFKNGNQVTPIRGDQADNSNEMSDTRFDKVDARFDELETQIKKQNEKSDAQFNQILILLKAAGTRSAAEVTTGGNERRADECLSNDMSIPPTSGIPNPNTDDLMADTQPYARPPTRSSANNTEGTSVSPPPRKRSRRETTTSAPKEPNEPSGSLPTRGRPISVPSTGTAGTSSQPDVQKRGRKGNGNRSKKTTPNERSGSPLTRRVPSPVASTSTVGIPVEPVLKKREQTIIDEKKIADPAFRPSALFYGKQLLEVQVEKIKSEGKGVSEKVERFIASYEEQDPLKVCRKLFNEKQHALDEYNYRRLDNYRMGSTCSLVDEITPEQNSETLEKPSEPPFLVDLSEKMSRSAKDIIEAADDYTATGRNTLYKEKELVPPEVNVDLKEKEFNYYNAESHDFGSDDFAKLRLAVPTIQLTSEEQLLSPELQQFCESHPISLICGLQKVTKMDGDLFTLEALSENYEATLLATNTKRINQIRISKQMPQSVNRNLDYSGKESWATYSINGKMMVLPTIRNLIEKEKKLAEKLYEAFGREEHKNPEEIILELMDKERTDDQLLWRHFGSNIDLYDQKYKMYGRQLEELQDKLPEFLRPKSSKNILSYAGYNIRGVNTAQLYGKGPGARTAAHMENSLMSSLNQNCGPGSCIWFAVSYEYWGKLVELVDKHHQKGHFHKQDYWPNEEELLKAGIPLYKFEQKKDEMVYVNIGTFHWVQSQGFCTNVSWNIGTPSAAQLATSIISAQHNIELSNLAIIPIRSLIVNLADRNLFKNNPDIRRIVTHQLALILFHARHLENMLNRKRVGRKKRGETYKSIHTVEKLMEIYDRWMDDAVPGNDGSYIDADFEPKNADNECLYRKKSGTNVRKVPRKKISDVGCSSLSFVSDSNFKRSDDADDEFPENDGFDDKQDDSKITNRDHTDLNKDEMDPSSPVPGTSSSSADPSNPASRRSSELEAFNDQQEMVEDEEMDVDPDHTD